MGFPIALVAGDYTNLRASGHKGDEYLLLGTNTTVFAARVNQATFAASFGQVTFDTVTTGAYTDVLEGMTVLISTTNDKRAAYFVGRVRADNSGVVSTSTVLNINESSATIADNDYLFVIRDYRLFHELGTYNGATYKKDYARLFSQLKPIISGLQSVYAGVVSGSPVGFTVSFAASAVAATSGATISSYAYTLPSGATATAGSVSTANVTVRFDASATEYWVKLLVTDSASRTQTRYIAVFAIPADLSTTITLGAGGANITGDIENGWNASVDGFAGFSSVLDNTLACILDVEYYGATQTSILSTIKFVGRMRTESNTTQADENIATSRKAGIEIEGIAAQMGRITTPVITMRDASSPTVWDEIFKLTVWRSVTYLLEHSTLHSLCSLTFDSTADTYYAYQLIAPQGNMLSAVNDLLKSSNAALEFAPTGEIRAVRNLNFLSTAERSALVTVANFDSQDWIGFTLKHEHVETVGLVEASGGTYFRTGGILPAMVTPLLSIAPGVAQGNAEGVSPLPSQILTANVARSVAQSELNTRAGNQFAFANGNDELSVNFRTGYNWLVPSRYQYYTFTIEAGDDTFGRAYTTANKWWCKSVSIRHENATGKKEVSADFVLETSGADAGATGQTVNIPPPGETPPALPPIPPGPAYPNFPPLPPIYLPDAPTPAQIPPYNDPGDVIGSIPLDGNAVVIWSVSHVWWTKTFLGSPIWFDITPPNSLGTIKDVALDAQRIYILSSDATDSILHSAENAFTATPTYVDSASVEGVYSEIRVASTQGAVYIAGAIPEVSAGAGTVTYDFTVSQYGFSIPPGDAVATGGYGAYVASTGFTMALGSGGFYFGSGYKSLSITQVTQVRLYVSNTVSTCHFHYNQAVPGDFGATTVLTPTNSSTGGNHYYYNFPSPTDLTTFQWYLDETASRTVTRLEFDSNDIIIPAGTASYYSTDYGATLGDLKSISTTLGAPLGFDTIKIGVQVMAGDASQVKIALAAGDFYQDYGSAFPTTGTPTCIVIPRRQFGGTSNNVTTATPQYLAASSVVSASGETMWKVTASGATFTAITPTFGGVDGLAINHRSAAMSWWDGNYIAAVMNYSGTPKLVVSTNAGGAWTDRGALNTNAKMVVYRRGDRTKQQLFITNGGPAYSPNHGASIVTKTYPADSASEPIIGIAAYG